MLTSSLLADLYILGMILTMGWHAWYCAQRGRWFVLDPLNAFWAGALVCYAWQPIAHFDTVAQWRGTDVGETTLLMALLSVVGVVVGYESGLGHRLTRRVAGMPAGLRPDRLILAALVLIALGIVGYGYFVASAGSLSAWLSVGRGGTRWENMNGYVAQLHSLLPVGVGLLLFHVELHRERTSLRVAAWLAAAVQWLWFIYLGSRSRTIVFALLMLAAYFLPKRRNPPLLLIPGMVAAMVVLVQFQTEYRGKFTNLSIWGNLDFEEVKASAPQWLVSGSSASGVSAGFEFNCAAAVVELVPDVVDYNYGYTHLELFTRPIPRAIWPDKIYPMYRAYTPLFREGRLSTTVIPNAKEYMLMGPSFTFVGHWYSVGGAIALIVAAILTGAMFRGIRGIYDRQPGNEGDVVLYASLVPLGFGEAAGEPLFFLFTLPFTLGPLLLVLWLCRAPVPTMTISNDSSEQADGGPPGASRGPVRGW